MVLGIDFSQMGLVKKIHMMVTGDEGVEDHLSGVAKLGADEVVIFELDSEKARLIEDRLGEIGVCYRSIKVSGNYIDAFKKANIEAGASFVDGSYVAVNVGCGSRIVVGAVEDAVRTQLFYFLTRRGSRIVAGAFRYQVERHKGEASVKYAPIWNLFSKDHNDIFEALAEAQEPIDLKRLWEFLCDTRGDTWGLEAFRKVFRDFKRWFTNLPCFEEKVKRGPQYRLRV